MVAVSSRGVERFLASPPPAMRLFLLFGGDAGAVTEGARRLEAAAVGRGGSAAIRFGSDEIAADPGRLADEAFAGNLFGGSPVIALRVLDGRHNVMAALAPLLERPPPDAVVIVEAGDLKADSALRKAFEAAPHAAAIPFYPMDDADVAALAAETAREAEVKIAPEALELLGAMLGGDRLAARGEIEKLVLYAGRGGRIAAEDVLALAGESAALRFDRIVDAALQGDGETVEADLVRLRGEGQSASALAAQALRHFLLLQDLSGEVAAGVPPAAAVERARPPVFPRRRNAVLAALRAWDDAALARGRALLADAVLEARRNPALEHAVVSDALQRIAAVRRRAGRRS